MGQAYRACRGVGSGQDRASGRQGSCWTWTRSTVKHAGSRGRGSFKYIPSTTTQHLGASGSLGSGSLTQKARPWHRIEGGQTGWQPGLLPGTPRFDMAVAMVACCSCLQLLRLELLFHSIQLGIPSSLPHSTASSLCFVPSSFILA